MENAELVRQQHRPKDKVKRAWGVEPIFLREKY
jgi:hypothetical protein